MGGIRITSRRNFLVQRAATLGDNQRMIALSFPSAYSAAKLELMNFAVDRLNQLLRLQPGWDGMSAAQIAETAAGSAVLWLDLVAEDDTSSPQIFPLLTGGVQIEWLAGGASLEIEIGPSGDMGFLGVDAAGNVVVEGDYPDPHGSPELIMPAREHLRALRGSPGH